MSTEDPRKQVSLDEVSGHWRWVKNGLMSVDEFNAKYQPYSIVIHNSDRFGMVCLVDRVSIETKPSEHGAE